MEGVAANLKRFRGNVGAFAHLQYPFPARIARTGPRRPEPFPCPAPASTTAGPWEGAPATRNAARCRAKGLYTTAALSAGEGRRSRQTHHGGTEELAVRSGLRYRAATGFSSSRSFESASTAGRSQSVGW